MLTLTDLQEHKMELRLEKRVSCFLFVGVVVKVVEVVIVGNVGSGFCASKNEDLFGSNISWTRISSWEKHTRMRVTPLCSCGPEAGGESRAGHRDPRPGGEGLGF